MAKDVPTPGIQQNMSLADLLADRIGEKSG
jgi:hypothetical protein